MEKAIRKNSNLIMCLAELIIGILLLINPVGFTRGIIIALGIPLALQGIASIVGYFREKPQAASEDNLLAKGLLMTCGGLFCVFRSRWFITVFPVLTMLYGVLTLVSAFGKLQWMADMLRLKHKYWYIALISAALSLVLAVLIIANPFSSSAALWVFIGISMIAEAVVDVVTFVFEKR